MVGQDGVVAVSELSPDDADWAAGLMDERRREYERYSPVFWRPAAQARARHVRFLRRQLADPATVALRSPRGFLIAQLRPAEAFVDDFAVDRAGTWSDDGAELLLAAWSRVRATGVGALRVVTAQADRPKSALLNGLGLDLAEQWWVHELPAAPSKAAGRNLVTMTGPSVTMTGPSPPSTDAPASGDSPASPAHSRVASGAPDPAAHPARPDQPAPTVISRPAVRSRPAAKAGSSGPPGSAGWPESAGPPDSPGPESPGPPGPTPVRRFEPPQRFEGPGFSGLFGSAPPVYDPGGPVLLADRVAAATDLAVLTAEAIRLGAVLLVVPAAPGSARARELDGCGWHVASDWYLGPPSATS